MAGVCEGGGTGEGKKSKGIEAKWEEWLGTLGPACKWVLFVSIFKRKLGEQVCLQPFDRLGVGRGDEHWNI